MSDLQDVIAANAVKAYNEGFARGEASERERIIKLLDTYFKPDEAKALYPSDYEQYLDLITLIKGEQK